MSKARQPAGRDAGKPAVRPKVVVIPHLGRFGELGEGEILERAGCEVVILDSRDEAVTIPACRDADGVIAAPHLSRRFMQGLRRCRVIACSSIGMDDVHGVDVATRKGIVICNSPDVLAEEVTNHTFALLLAAARRIPAMSQWVRDGHWGRSQRPAGSIPALAGRILGLIGFGNVGRGMAARAACFGMRVLAYDPYVSDEVFRCHLVQRAGLAQVLQDSDFLCLLVPLTAETRRMIAAPQLSLMKNGAILVNTSRGEVIDEAALVEALRCGRLLAAALDVLGQEPPAGDNPLLAMGNVIVTPHMSSLSDRADVERRLRPPREVAAVLTGHRPRFCWNREVLERLPLR